jgi:hypothetical protein
MPTIPNPSTFAVAHARINATSDGDNEVVAAVAGKKVRVLSYVLTASAAGIVDVQDTAASPAILAQFDLAAQGGVSYAGGVHAPAFETAEGTGLEVNTQASQDVVGHVTYQLV